MDMYWCPHCQKLVRFICRFHVGKWVHYGICKKCNSCFEGEELEELYEKGKLK